MVARMDDRTAISAVPAHLDGRIRQDWTRAEIAALFGLMFDPEIAEQTQVVEARAAALAVAAAFIKSQRPLCCTRQRP